MRRFILLAIAALAALAVMPSVALADPAICHNGILSDDAGQGCADGLYAQVYGSGGSSSRGSTADICHNGILSDDAGHGCSSWSAPSRTTVSSSSGSSNPMVNPACESSGNPQVVDPSGKYWGKYQFDYGTWVAHGGSPGAYGNASEGMQDQVAARVQYDAWPNC
jgi:hypothetical protein